MKKLIIIGVVTATTPAAAQYYGTGSNSSDHYVSGHTRDNGTYVPPHYQTNPNGYGGDNYGASGNYNPHNGSTGRRHYGY